MSVYKITYNQKRGGFGKKDKKDQVVKITEDRIQSILDRCAFIRKNIPLNMKNINILLEQLNEVKDWKKIFDAKIESEIQKIESQSKYKNDKVYLEIIEEEKSKVRNQNFKKIENTIKSVVDFINENKTIQALKSNLVDDLVLVVKECNKILPDMKKNDKGDNLLLRTQYDDILKYEDKIESEYKFIILSNKLLILINSLSKGQKVEIDAILQCGEFLLNDKVISIIDADFPFFGGILKTTNNIINLTENNFITKNILRLTKKGDNYSKDQTSILIKNVENAIINPTFESITRKVLNSTQESLSTVADLASEGADGEIAVDFVFDAIDTINVLIANVIVISTLVLETIPLVIDLISCDFEGPSKMRGKYTFLKNKHKDIYKMIYRYVCPALLNLFNKVAELIGGLISTIIPDDMGFFSTFIPELLIGLITSATQSTVIFDKLTTMWEGISEEWKNRILNPGLLSDWIFENLLKIKVFFHKNRDSNVFDGVRKDTQNIFSHLTKQNIFKTLKEVGASVSTNFKRMENDVIHLVEVLIDSLISIRHVIAGLINKAFSFAFLAIFFIFDCTKNKSLLTFKNKDGKAYELHKSLIDTSGRTLEQLVGNDNPIPLIKN